MRAISHTLVLFSLTLGGCAQDDGDIESAAQGWRAASIALDGANAELEAEADVDGHGDVTVACPGGGQLRIVGTYSVESGAEGQHVAEEADVEFDGCVAEGIAIDGSLHVVASVATSEHAVTVDIDYSGTLQWSGELEGTCDFDVEGHIATETAGGDLDVRVELSGTVCGADADAVVEAAGG
jgi:hypothetical protein